MKVKVVVCTAFVAAGLAVVPMIAHASCSPSAEQAALLSRAVDGELARLAPWHPGADPRDAEWLKGNVVGLVPDWLPGTRKMVVRAEADIGRVVDDCHRPTDYTVPGPERSAFAACAKEAALTRLAPAHVAEWGAFCGEVRQSLQDPAIEAKVRDWARHWVDAYIEHVRTRPAR
ncbi:hypothetical protein [Saccharothrix australiensis]|uniref:Uncharacterized protein n=1 Tax=Saccharothrix australiensis TaxID=2072 RepID=A0A495W127_9PSEU|nr:hypothetical protein [Saccharothrix australiensis]RKT54405.1 hypothetical protein C8E97_3025 [Saccharothrix australiensis]